MSSSFTYTTPPEAIGAELQRRIARIPDALFDVGQHYASQMQSYAQENAPWEDQSGDARKGIAGEVIREGDTIRIVIYNEIEEYPIYLELGTAPRDTGHRGMAPRPIILPTMQRYQTEIVETAARTVSSLLAGGGMR